MLLRVLQQLLLARLPFVLVLVLVQGVLVLHKIVETRSQIVAPLLPQLLELALVQSGSLTFLQERLDNSDVHDALKRRRVHVQLRLVRQIHVNGVNKQRNNVEKVHAVRFQERFHSVLFQPIAALAQVLQEKSKIVPVFLVARQPFSFLKQCPGDAELFPHKLYKKQMKNGRLR